MLSLRKKLIFTALIAISIFTALPTLAETNPIKNVVLVHGAFVDGSGWQGVFKELKNNGYNVTIVQNPTTSLADDVTITKNAIAAMDGPVILVGHSYGGVIITEVGNDPKVKGLVYIAAFVPDAGESVQTLISNPPAGAPHPPILPPQNGFLLMDQQKFPAAFAADVDKDTAELMAASQVPWGLSALVGSVTIPAWKNKPSWYLVTKNDKMIPPSAQHHMASRAGSHVTEVASSHSVYVSQTKAVSKLIEQAAQSIEF
jgi:pimeloyl-ACP methyl ester carboxylesterase